MLGLSQMSLNCDDSFVWLVYIVLSFWAQEHQVCLFYRHAFCIYMLTMNGIPLEKERLLQ